MRRRKKLKAAFADARRGSITKATKTARLNMSVECTTTAVMKIVVRGDRRYGFKVPVAEILAALPTVEILEEIDKRTKGDDVNVLADLLQSRGDPLGMHVAEFIQRRVMLRHSGPSQTNAAVARGGASTSSTRSSPGLDPVPLKSGSGPQGPSPASPGLETNATSK